MTERHTIALQEALHWINNHFNAIGIVVSGSIVRGNADVHSDFDIFVIHEEPWRQRVQKYFNGVPCELFINNPAQVYLYFENELKNNRPVTANIISTGKIVKGAHDARLQQLWKDAATYATQSPVVTEEQLLFRIYGMSNMLEDATDVLNTDTATAQYFLDKTIIELVDFLFLRNKTPLPRTKERLAILQEIEPGAGKKIAAYYASGTCQDKYALVSDLLYTLFNQSGFFEWSSGAE